MRRDDTYRTLAFLAVALVGTASSAFAMDCTIHPRKGAGKAELAKLVKIPLAKAREIAVASLKANASPASVESELEVEHGCLLYSFDIRLPHGDGAEEVQIDAGNGKVLAHQHESAKAEAAEKAKEAKPPGRHR